MSDAETILQKCNEMIEAREKASQSVWFAETNNRMNCLMRNEPDTEHYFYADGNVEEDADNFQFCAHAANSSAQLAKALKVMCEALEEIKGEMRANLDDFKMKDDYLAIRISTRLEADCEDALQGAALILKEGTL